MNNFFQTIRLCIIFVSIIFFANTSLGKSNDSPNLDVVAEKKISWEHWILSTKKNLKKKRFNQKTINYLSEIKFNSKVIELDRKQPEFTLSFDKYYKNVVNDKSKNNINVQFSKQRKLLQRIEKKFGVNSRILVALWGIETSFGKHTGKLDILRSLASLAYDGRRKDFFTKELENALKILEKGHFERNSFKGSWAGAFGQTQFMPSTFLKYAVDFDGDKKINLFNKTDALASGANYLNKIGWNNNIDWGEKVKIKLTNELELLAKQKKYMDINFWQKSGVIFKKKYSNVGLRLIVPDSNNNNECYLVTKNFDVILNWNRSNYFALTVFLFSDEIK